MRHLFKQRLIHTSALPASLAYIKGTVNEPTTYPPPSAAHGSYHWLTERGLSVALIPLFAAGAAKHGASGVLDATLALSLVLHSHIGFTASLDDYVHKRKFPVLGPVAAWTLRAATLATLAGLYEFQTSACRGASACDGIQLLTMHVFLQLLPFYSLSFRRRR